MPKTRDVLVLLAWLAGLLTAAALLLVTTGPVLGAVSRTAGPDTVVAAAAAVAGWLVLGWLAVGVALTLGELAADAWARRRHPTALSRPGRACTTLIEVFALAPMRDAVRSSLRVGAVGLVSGSVAIAVATPTIAWAEAPVGEGTARSTADVRLTDRVVPRHWPSLDRPAQPVGATALVPPRTPPTADQSPSAPAATYRVRAGDTLWSIAAAHLPGTATDREVAVAWPRWWQANRAVIGSDPGLIRPGQLLVDPGHRS